LENFNNLTWLVAREDFIKVGNIFVQNYWACEREINLGMENKFHSESIHSLPHITGIIKLRRMKLVGDVARLAETWNV
jgi:hypothetical protein